MNAGSIKRQFYFVSFVALTICTAPNRASAQSVGTVHQFETENHLGTPEEALVGITVVDRSPDGTNQVRHGNGMFIRCDGYVLAPESLFALTDSKSKPDQSVTIVLHPGTDHEKSIAAARPGNFGVLSVGDRWMRIPYAVLKLGDVHLAAPRILSPSAVSSGDALRVICSPWSSEKKRFQPLQSSSALAGAIARSTAAKQGSPPTGFIPPRFVAQETHFKQPPAPGSVSNSAFVVGPEDTVVGLVVQSPSEVASSYVNFDALDQVTNCVAALPSTSAQFAAMLKSAELAVAPGSPSPLRSQSDMIHIPGGPIKLPTVLKAYESELEKTYDVCMQPFDVDRYEVTNQQYLEFWMSMPVSERKENYSALYPLSWGDVTSPFPAGMATNPVLGVRLTGAQAFARWAGKRLLTPCEWCLAAFGRYGGNRPPEWADKYIHARQTAWEKIVQAHIAYARQHPDILPGFTIRRDITNDITEHPDWSRPVLEEFLQIPWFFMRPGYAAAAAWSHECVKQNTDALFREWVDPGYVLPVGSRPYDVSPLGVADMIMNARELVLPGPHGMWQKLPGDHWGYKGVDRYMEVDWVQGGLITPQFYLYGTGPWNTGQPKTTEKQILLDPLSAVINLDVVLQNYSFLLNNLLIAHPAHNEQGNIATIIMNPGAPFTGLQMPLNSIDQPIPPEEDSKLLGLYHPVTSYAYRMPSRRIRSAAQNAGVGSGASVPADLGDYVAACATVQEYAEQLRPANTCMLNLVAGPGFDTVYWSGSGTWGITGDFLINGPTSTQRVGKVIVRNNPIGDTGLNEWTADATCISLTGAFPSWANGPDHYHDEMGRRTAIDAKYPINSRNTNQVVARRFATDSFLIPGGFRCAR